jgi:hypothetical protein
VDREKLVALRAAINTMLEWLGPEPVRPNGHDPDPTMTTITPTASKPVSSLRREASAPRRSPGKAATPAQAAERR